MGVVLAIVHRMNPNDPYQPQEGKPGRKNMLGATFNCGRYIETPVKIVPGEFA